MSEASAAPAVNVADDVNDDLVCFHPLVFHTDGGGTTVGRLATGTFVQLPPDGAALLRRLVDGDPPSAAARWYLHTYGEPIDVPGFVADLVDLEFVLDDDAAPPDQPLRWSRLGCWVFSPWGLLAFVGLLIAWGVAMARSPVLVPTHEDVLFTPYMSVMAVTVLLVQVPLVLLHEAAHMLAGRRIGLPSRLSIGRRLHMLVFQTTMNGLVVVPRGKRILPIVAGVLCDLAMMAFLTLIAAGTRHPDGSLSLVGGVALATSYVTLLRILWQCYFFLRTDFYYLVTTVLGCIDLHDTTLQLMKNTVRRWFGRPARHDPRLWSPRDHAVARWYSVLTVLGVVGFVVVLVRGVLPIIWHVVSTVVGRLTGNGDHGTAGVLDSTVLLILALAELAAGGYLYMRERRQAADRAAPPTPVLL